MDTTGRLESWLSEVAAERGRETSIGDFLDMGCDLKHHLDNSSAANNETDSEILRQYRVFFSAGDNVYRELELHFTEGRMQLDDPSVANFEEFQDILSSRREHFYEGHSESQKLLQQLDDDDPSAANNEEHPELVSDLRGRFFVGYEKFQELRRWLNEGDMRPDGTLVISIANSPAGRPMRRLNVN